MDPLLEFALLLKAAERELERRVNEAMEPLGLTAAQADALVVIGQAEPLSLKDLGELLIAEAGHPSRLVDRLVESGLVDRRPAADDRRRLQLSLTPSGRKLEGKIDAAREKIRELSMVLLGGREFEPTLELFRSLVQTTPFAGLIARRRELIAAASGRTREVRKHARSGPAAEGRRGTKR